MTRMSGTPNEANSASVRAVPDPPLEPKEIVVESHTCQHPVGPGQGCMWCCDLCNHDMHHCGGCGDNVKHGAYVCTECAVLP